MLCTALNSLIVAASHLGYLPDDIADAQTKVEPLRNFSWRATTCKPRECTGCPHSRTIEIDGGLLYVLPCTKRPSTALSVHSLASCG